MRQIPTALSESIDEAVFAVVARRMVIQSAKAFVDVKEEGKNKGYFIELIQLTSDGRANGESYCCAFVQSLIAYVENKFNRTSLVFNSESVMEMWNNSPEEIKTLEGMVGDIAVWNHVGTSRGHCGIVVEVTDKGFMCVEGNTNSGSAGFSQGNDGEGIYLKERPLGDVGTMKLLGFIKPF